MCSSVEKEALNAGISLEALDAIWLVNGTISDLELSKSESQDIEEVFELRINDGLGSWVGIPKP
jgi:hypothetical protein